MENTQLENFKDLYNKVYNLRSFTYVFDFENQKKEKTKKQYMKEYNNLKQNIKELLDKMDQIKSDLYQSWQWF